jgi:hypothetical protein
LIEAQEVGFEVFMRRKRYLLATKCALAIQAIDSQASAWTICQESLKNLLSSKPEDLSPKVADIITSETKSLL